MVDRVRTVDSFPQQVTLTVTKASPSNTDAATNITFPAPRGIPVRKGKTLLAELLYVDAFRIFTPDINPAMGTSDTIIYQAQLRMGSYNLASIAALGVEDPRQILLWDEIIRVTDYDSTGSVLVKIEAYKRFNLQSTDGRGILFPGTTMGAFLFGEADTIANTKITWKVYYRWVEVNTEDVFQLSQQLSGD